MSDFCTEHYLLFPCRKCASGAPRVPPYSFASADEIEMVPGGRKATAQEWLGWVPFAIKEIERLRSALGNIADHFDDQGFPRHSDVDCCDEILVNFAMAVYYDGYVGYIGDYYKGVFCRDE